MCSRFFHQLFECNIFSNTLLAQYSCYLLMLFFFRNRKLFLSGDIIFILESFILNLSVLEFISHCNHMNLFSLKIELVINDLSEQFPPLLQHLYLRPVCVYEVGPLHVQARPLHHQVCNHLNDSDEFNRVQRVFISLQVKFNQEYFMELILSFHVDQVHSDLSSVDRARRLSDVTVHLALGLLDEVGA